MTRTHRSTTTLVTVLFTVLLAMSGGAAMAAGDTETTRFPQGLDNTAILASIEDAREEARASNRLLMVVLGADWCHDSRAFVDYLDDPAFRSLIDERYVVEKVNVGFYEHVRGIVDTWNVPIIYGTPTVLVEEPVTGTVLNRDTLPHWRNADALGADEALRYFSEFEPGKAPAETTPSASLSEALTAIDQFERAQAERIYVAYAELGALMEAMGDERPDAEFMEKWDNLAAMRGDITKDLSRLRTEAIALDEAGVTDIPLELPTYDLFID